MTQVLVGLPAIGLKGKCRRLLKFPEEPSRWEPPGVPDVVAGTWPPMMVQPFPLQLEGALWGLVSHNSFHFDR
mgnify:CR=1 FL=1